MLFLTLLAGCLLAALQISNVIGLSGYREKYVRLVAWKIPENAIIKYKQNYPFKHGRCAVRIDDLRKCLHHSPPVRLAVNVTDYQQFVDISIKDDLTSVIVKREKCTTDTVVRIEFGCRMPLVTF